MDEFHEMVVDIKAAIAAAEENRHCYELRPDGNDYDEDEVTNDEDMEQYRRLIPGKRLHSLQTDKVIQDEDLEFIVNNMDTVRKLGVPNVPLGVAAIDALRCHHAMIVELSLQCGSTNISQALSTVTGPLNWRSWYWTSSRLWSYSRTEALQWISRLESLEYMFCRASHQKKDSAFK
ncbi:hypothetical protein MVEG_03188 [Podila verticillata NRRL 6337]|nr:hypothetical protein MVEG_03188 [Podila verticillata NRRL 6337]